MTITTDHDRLIRVDERGEGMASDIAEIKEWMKSRPCPSNLCKDHSERITTIEAENKERDKGISHIVAYLALIVSFVSVAVAIYEETRH